MADLASASSIFRLAHRGWGSAVDLLMPPTCAACKAPVAAHGGLCASCWGQLPVPDGARCSTCSVPLPTIWASEASCLACLAEPPAFDTAVAPFRYEGVARDLVLGLKNGREELALLLARTMLPALRPHVEGHAVPTLVPVPLARWRLFRRGYNQAALLARALGLLAGWPLLVDALVRRRETPSSAGLGRAERRRNVAGAFAVRPDRAARLAGGTIVLVDDVMTSGATADAAARVLKRAGAAHILVVTCARVAAEGRGAYAPGFRGGDQHGQD